MKGTSLPNAHAAFVSNAKIQDYLLDPSHPDNGGKAAFFAAFGFGPQNWTRLRDALAAHPTTNLIVNAEPSLWGVKYEVRCRLPSPDGRDPCVRSIWIVDVVSPNPRLVTAYP